MACVGAIGVNELRPVAGGGRYGPLELTGDWGAKGGYAYSSLTQRDVLAKTVPCNYPCRFASPDPTFVINEIPREEMLAQLLGIFLCHI